MQGFARLTGVNERTFHSWVSGELGIPRLVELFLEFAMCKPEVFRERVKAQEMLDDEL